MLSLHFHELMEKIEEREGKNSWLLDSYILDKVLDDIKETIDIEKFDDIKILIDMNNELPDDITFKNVVILMTCVIKDNDKIYPKIFLEEALYDK